MAVKGETPEGFLKHAREFWRAADLVLSKADNVSLPAYFLLGRSIELSLKAFLLHCGVEISQLKKKPFGHDLRYLLKEAKVKGLEQRLPLESIESGVVDLLSYDYSEKNLEYLITKGTYYLPLLQPTREIARKLAYDLDSVWGISE